MKLLVLPGDGIGPEIITAAEPVLDTLDRRFGLGLELKQADIGFASLERHGSTLPEEALAQAREADGVILGPVSHAEYPPSERGGINPSGGLRIALDLYANIRPSRCRLGVPSPASVMDLVIVRENTEGFYADRTMHRGSGEFMPSPDLALAVRKITRQGAARVMRVGCELARRRRNKVTLVHKANVLKLSDGLFREAALAVAREYPELSVEEQHVDATAAALVRSPESFDVIVTSNMFGDILSNEAAELAGGLGLAASLNRGEAHAVAQAAHGSAPDIAGRDLANPLSLILSAGLLLDWLGERHGRPEFNAAARSLETAVDALLADPTTRTRDLGGTLGTAAFGQALAQAVARTGQ